MDFYAQGKSYYDRNVDRYELQSWYMFNKYKHAMVQRELQCCLRELQGKDSIRILEIGPGPGYLLSKLVKMTDVPIDYTGIEHSIEMAKVSRERWKSFCRDFKILNESVTAEYIRGLPQDEGYDLVMGSTILSHLPDYEEVVAGLAKRVKPGGMMYFVREPLHRSECQPDSPLGKLLNFVYEAVNNFYLAPPAKKFFWPDKIKAESQTDVAYHMYRDGVSITAFDQLTKNGFQFIFLRKYNRRASGFMSYLENEWLKNYRLDIFRNTLFSVGLKKY